MTVADTSTIPFTEQLHLLLKYVRDPHGQTYSATHLAHLLGMSPQAVLNLLNGHTQSPRLDTVRLLCKCFGVSLDYFALTTREACERYLKHYVVTRSTSTIQAINVRANQLSPQAAQRVLMVLSWAENGANRSGV